MSAAQFVQDQPDTIALVASQDGRFTVFAWSGCDGMVQAHRVIDAAVADWVDGAPGRHGLGCYQFAHRRDLPIFFAGST